ncbi:MAG: DUF1573 domain-containing protein [Ignavibacteria bacterium]
MKRAFILLLLISVVSFAQLAGPKISATHNSYDFGNIRQNIFVEHDFVITNNGDALLIINEVKAPCDCTDAKTGTDTLIPGASTNINIKFNTIGREGHQQKYVYVYSNDKENPELRLSFTAEVIPDKPGADTSLAPKLVLNSNQHDFGQLKAGEIVEWVADFTNAGKSPLEIKEVKTSCGCTAVVVSEKEIQPGEKGNLKIKFDSTNKIGRLSRTVTILSNDSVYPEQTIVISAEVLAGK